MNCTQVVDFLMAYLDCELDPATRRAFEYHLSLCPPCVAFMRSYEQSVRLGREAFHCNQPAQAKVPEELIKAILAATRAQPSDPAGLPACPPPTTPPGPAR